MRVLVCGGRSFGDEKVYSGGRMVLADASVEDRALLRETLRLLNEEVRIDFVCTGDAQGADRLAREWAAENRVAYRVFLADWGKHGKKAGPLRNRRMLEEGEPDLVVAFAGGAGTADMVRQAERAGVKVIQVDRAVPRLVGS